MLYKLNLTPQELKTLGFRYDNQSDDYIYEFPVYKSNGKIMLTCKIGVVGETNQVWLNVYDENKKLYSSYYNREFGISNIVRIVDRNIVKELLRLGAEEIEE